MTVEKYVWTKAYRGFKCVIVKECPFCNKMHEHSETSKQGDYKTAECLLGEYILSFE